METGEIEPIHNNRILAFHGFESAHPSAVGQVSVDLDCIKGVTTVETIEEPMLVDVETLEEDTREYETHHLTDPRSEILKD